MKTSSLKSTLLAAAGIFALSSAANAVITTMPVEYWDMDGDVLAAIDNANNDGTIVTNNGGTGTFVAGKFGQAIDLESTGAANAWVQVADGDGTFDMADDNGTFSLWFTLEQYDVSWQALLTGGEGGNFRIHRQNNTANLQVNMQGGAVLNVGPIATANATWHHLAFSSDDTAGTQVWFDGVLTSNATVRDIGANGFDFFIGNNAQGLGRAWDGNIDDVAFWSTALTDADIQQIWNGGQGASIQSLLIPEPAAMSLFGLAGIALILRRRRR